MTELASPTADESAVAAFARAVLDLDIPPEALPGVCLNLAALADHWRRVAADAALPAMR